MRLRTKKTDWREVQSFDEVVVAASGLGWRKNDDSFLVLEELGRGFAQIAHCRSGKYLAEWRTPSAGKLLRAQTRKTLGRVLDRPPRNSSKFAIYQADILTLQQCLDILLEFWSKNRKPGRFFWRDLTPLLRRWSKLEAARKALELRKASKRIGKNMKITKPAPKKIHDLHAGDVIVDVDWCSTGIWFFSKKAGHVCMGFYEDFPFPKALVERFQFWTGWHNSHEPWNGETIDYDLFRAYGRALAVDVKRIMGNKRRVFYNFYADNKRKCQVSEEEILLPDEKKLRESIRENNRINKKPAKKPV